MQWPYYVVLVGMLLLTRYCWHLAPSDPDKFLRAIATAHATHDLASSETYMKAWLPRVGKAEFFICLLLLALGPLLVGVERGAKTPSPRPPDRLLWSLTGLMVVSSAWLNAPRLSHSFWNDEEWTARRLIVGDLNAGEHSQKPSWNRTLFFYIDPNNHPLFSVLARLSNSLVPEPKEKGEFAFREWPIRLPSFLFGLGGLITVAWLAIVTGMPRAGMIAVVWLALHPWHVRYGVDARGYALLLTLIPLATALLWRAFATGEMRDWLAFGLAEFLVLWTYPGALYFVLVLNLLACGMLATQRLPLPGALMWRRYVTANVIGAMLTLLMLSPCLQPMLIFLHGGRLRGDLSLAWFKEAASGLTTGLPWANWGDHDLALSWMRTWDNSAGLVLLTLGMVGAVLLAGIVNMLREPKRRWLLGMLLGAGPVMVLVAKSQGNFLYPWYLVICLPGVALTFGAGLDALAARLPAKGRVLFTILVLGLFGTSTWRQNTLLRTHPVEQMRESVAATRTDLNDKVLTGSASFPPRLYDPAAVPLKSANDLRDLMARADARKLPLYVNIGDESFLKLRDPSLVDLLKDRTFFEELPPFWGIHGQHERYVYRYLPAKR